MFCLHNFSLDPLLHVIPLEGHQIHELIVCACYVTFSPQNLKLIPT